MMLLWLLALMESENGEGQREGEKMDPKQTKGIQEIEKDTALTKEFYSFFFSDKEEEEEERTRLMKTRKAIEKKGQKVQNQNEE